MRRTLIVTLIVWTGCAAAMPAHAGHRLGVRAGGMDDFYVGAEWQIPARLGPALLAPSLDASFGDFDASTLNLDLKWDLLPLLDTGLMFSGKAGPTIVFADGESDLGFSLTAGLDIGLRRARSLQVEWRFGFGDAPERKLGLALMFGL